jgi:hypothetical protein
VIIVVLVLVVAVYAIISLATGDWMWFSANFDETPNSILVHCYGQTTEISPGTFEFSALTEIVNESMSGRKRWDSLSLSEVTYQEYQTNPQMKAIEIFYPEPVRVHTANRFFSNVNNLIIPLEGRHAQTNPVFGRNNGVPAAGSLHLQSTERFNEFLHYQDLCPAATPVSGG